VGLCFYYSIEGKARSVQTKVIKSYLLFQCLHERQKMQGKLVVYVKKVLLSEEVYAWWSWPLVSYIGALQ